MSRLATALCALTLLGLLVALVLVARMALTPRTATVSVAVPVRQPLPVSPPAAEISTPPAPVAPVEPETVPAPLAIEIPPSPLDTPPTEPEAVVPPVAATPPVRARVINTPRRSPPVPVSLTPVDKMTAADRLVRDAEAAELRRRETFARMRREEELPWWVRVYMFAR